MAAEALEFHIEGMLEEGSANPLLRRSTPSWPTRRTPRRSPFVAVPDRDGAGAGQLDAPEADLEELDALAKKQGKSRSAVLTEAARRMIAASKDITPPEPVGDAGHEQADPALVGLASRRARR